MEGFVENPELRDKVRVFADRQHAGRMLAELLEAFRGSDAIVMAIPAGGVPVAAAVAAGIGLPLDVAVVSKITPPFDSEVGYGAVAFDGSVGLNDDLVARLKLGEDAIVEGVEKTAARVMQRVARFRGERPMPELEGRTAILVDDGLASGMTMLVAAQALRREGALQVVAAVPTGHLESVRRVSSEVSGLVCANVRSGLSFAVADAYERWHDVSEDEAADLLERFAGSSGS
jgi:putative phosphoribosyl transferase